MEGDEDLVTSVRLPRALLAEVDECLKKYGYTNRTDLIKTTVRIYLRELKQNEGLDEVVSHEATREPPAPRATPYYAVNAQAPPAATQTRPCVACGYQLAPGSVRCPSCAAPVGKLCPSCGAQVEEWHRACSRCGYVWPRP